MNSQQTINAINKHQRAYYTSNRTGIWPYLQQKPEQLPSNKDVNERGLALVRPKSELDQEKLLISSKGQGTI